MIQTNRGDKIIFERSPYVEGQYILSIHRRVHGMNLTPEVTVLTQNEAKLLAYEILGVLPAEPN